jgi:hypothetical protein
MHPVIICDLSGDRIRWMWTLNVCHRLHVTNIDYNNAALVLFAVAQKGIRREFDDNPIQTIHFPKQTSTNNKN